jgi:SAM-dependent methyltransferase
MQAPLPQFASEYYHDVDLRVVQAVPADALAILDIDCRTGRLGEVLKHMRPERHVIGLKRANGGTDEQAASRLDRVLSDDLENDSLPLEKQSLDCIVADDVLARHADPCAILQTLRPLLRPGGRLIASLPNAQHWSVIDGLLRGNLQRSGISWGPRAPTCKAAFAIADIVKLFLDAGYLPRIVDRRSIAAPPDWLVSAQPALTRQRLDISSFAARSQTCQYVIEARPLDLSDLPDAPVRPTTVGACCNDPDVLRENLFASPCLRSSAHETLTVENAPSAGDGLNALIARAGHELVVLAHQDVYLPEWWINRLWQQYDRARRDTGDRVGVMGLFGLSVERDAIRHHGRVVDREFLLDEAPPLPAPVDSLDELLLVVPKNTPLRFDPRLGFHLYGTDICLTAKAAGLHAICIDAPCHHDSKQGDALPPAFSRSRQILREKWPDSLPIATPCGIIT